MHHRKKIDKQYFEAALAGLKGFEIRRNDCDYRIGDTIDLCETVYTSREMFDGKPVEFTGRDISVVISYILHGEEGGALALGWCILSFHVLRHTRIKEFINLVMGTPIEEVTFENTAPGKFEAPNGDSMTVITKMDVAFSEFTTTKRLCRGRWSICCDKGNWSVEAPTEDEALNEARNYFRQYWEDGEYNETAC